MLAEPVDPVIADAGWVILATAGLFAGWAGTLGARDVNRRGGSGVALALLGVALLSAAGGAAALIWSLVAGGLDPTAHAYPAIMWALAVWIGAHTVAGVLLQSYCIAGLIFGKLTPRYDADLWNVTLFWHFLVASALVACAMIGLVPRLL